MPRPVSSSPAALPDGASTLPFRRWSCTHFGREAEIDVWVEETGLWETVATVRPVGNQDAEDIASLIVATLNRTSSM